MALHAGSALALAAGGLRRRRDRLALLAARDGAARRSPGSLLEGPIERRLSAPGAMAAGPARGLGRARRRATGARRRARPAEARRRRRALRSGSRRPPRSRRASRAAARCARRRGRAGSRARAAAELAAETALPVLAGAAALKGVRLARRRPSARELAALGGGRGRGGALDGGGALRSRGGRSRRPPCGRPTATALAAAVPPTARPPQWAAMTAAYASSGVDTGAADRAVAALVGVLKTIDIGRASRSVLGVRPLRGRARGGAEPRHRRRHRRRRLEADRRRADRPLRHGRDRLHRDERQRRRSASAPSRSRCSTTWPSSAPTRPSCARSAPA